MKQHCLDLMSLDTLFFHHTRARMPPSTHLNTCLQTIINDRSWWRYTCFLFNLLTTPLLYNWPLFNIIKNFVSSERRAGFFILQTVVSMTWWNYVFSSDDIKKQKHDNSVIISCIFYDPVTVYFLQMFSYQLWFKCTRQSV